VVQRFAQEHLLFPKRSTAVCGRANMLWGRLNRQPCFGDLKNPSYAGVYTFGRYRCVKEILAEGAVRSRIACMPRTEWLVEIQVTMKVIRRLKHVLKNLAAIDATARIQEAILSGPAREGLALLQGLLICGCCGTASDASLSRQRWPVFHLRMQLAETGRIAQGILQCRCNAAA